MSWPSVTSDLAATGNARSSLSEPSRATRTVVVIRSLGEAPLLAEADLLHEGDEIVHQVLLDDLAVVPLRDRIEVEIEGLARRGDHGAIRALHRSGHRAPEASDRAGVVARGEEDPVRPVFEALIRERLPEVDRFLRVVLDADGRLRLARPPDDHIGFVPCPEDLHVLLVPCVVQGLHEFLVSGGDTVAFLARVPGGRQRDAPLRAARGLRTALSST